MIAVDTKPPVHVDSRVERRSDGSYYVGACFERHGNWVWSKLKARRHGNWVWSKLKARRADTAKEQAPEAIAHLMVNHAKALEEQAEDLLTKARFLRDCARMKGIIG